MRFLLPSIGKSMATATVLATLGLTTHSTANTPSLALTGTELRSEQPNDTIAGKTTLSDTDIVRRYLPHLTPSSNQMVVRINGALPKDAELLHLDTQSMLSLVESPYLEALVAREDVVFHAPVFTNAQTWFALTDTIIIRFQEGVSRTQQEQLLADHGFTLKPTGLNFQLATYNGTSGLQMLPKVDALRQNPLVKLCNADWITESTKSNFTGRFGAKDFGGTSGAVAVTAGIAGLAWNANPGLSGQDVINIILGTAFQGLETRIDQNAFGFGLVNPVDSVRIAFETAPALAGESGNPTFFPLFPFDDPIHAFQWYMNGAQGVFQAASPVVSELMNISGFQGAWSLYSTNTNRTGASMDPQTTPIRYLIIDDGVATNHPELNVVAGYSLEYDLLNNTYTLTGSNVINSQPLSGTSHGTAVAGILAARDNAVGTIGITPGFPIVTMGIRDTEGRRGNNSAVRFANVILLLDAAYEIILDNPQNRYVIPITYYTFANDPSLYSKVLPGSGTLTALGFVVDDILSTQRGICVFPAGNGNDQLLTPEDPNQFSAFFNPYVNVSLPDLNPDDQVTGFNKALVVGAVHSRAYAGGAQDGKREDKASYSNYNPSINIAAPSGDEFVRGSNPDFTLIENKLQLPTTSMSLFSMGAESLTPYDLLHNVDVSRIGNTFYGIASINTEMPPHTVVGIENWTAAFRSLFATFEIKDNPLTPAVIEVSTTLGNGILATFPAGYAKIYPVLTQDERGNLTGYVEVAVFDANDLQTSSFIIPNATGKFRYSRTGTYKSKERVVSSFSLKARDAQGNSITLSGKENFSVINGVLENRPNVTPAPSSVVSTDQGLILTGVSPANFGIKPPSGGNNGNSTPKAQPRQVGFKTSGSVNFKGLGVKSRITGVLLRADTKDESKVNVDVAVGDSIVYSTGTFYSPNLSLERSLSGDREIYSGTPSFDSPFGALLTPANARKDVVRSTITYSTPTRFGTAVTTARSGVYSAKSTLSHTANTSQKRYELVDIFSYPTALQFRSPSANTTLVNKIPFGQLVSD
jgi:hypothetical protein